MAIYYNPTKPDSLDIKGFELPAFANQYLQFLLIEKNMAPGTIFNYAVSLRTFLRWVKSTQLDHAAQEELDKLKQMAESIANKKDDNKESAPAEEAAADKAEKPQNGEKKGGKIDPAALAAKANSIKNK